MKQKITIKQILVSIMLLTVFGLQAEVTIYKTEMTSTTLGGVAYLLKEHVVLEKYEVVSFVGFNQDLTDMLRPDLFDSISGTKARFIGHACEWRAFYNTVNKFMYLQTYNNEEGLLWFAGLGGGFPLKPYIATSDWFGTEGHGYFSFKNTGENTFEMLIYLNSDMAFQVYRKVAWGTVVSPLTSLTPALLTVKSNNDAVAGPNFTPGVYNLKVDVQAKTAELIPYSDPNLNAKHLVDLVGGQFPIVAWTGIDANDSETKFPAMKEAGINIYLGRYLNQNEADSVLQSAVNADVKVILSCPELDTSTEQVVGDMKKYSSFYGYFLADEPEESDFSTLSTKVKKIQSYDTKHPCYIDLFPNWAWGGADGYATKVRAFLNQVPVPFVTFDYYPVIEINGVSTLRPNWYKNLEDVSAITREKGIPFWAFALALSHTLGNEFYPIPTIGELRLQMFSNLVYGAQGFQYFTYWGIYQSGPTNVYPLVKIVNEELQGLSGVFLDADVISVWHTGSQLPYGTCPISKLPAPIKSLTTTDGGAIVSYLQKGENQYLAVVNRDYINPMQLTISLAEDVKRVQKTVQ